MIKYILDTNIWADIGRGKIAPVDLEGLPHSKPCEFWWAPPVLIELFGGVIKGGDTHFRRNQRIFNCGRELHSEILDLPIPFIWKRLWNVSQSNSHVVPLHYQQLIEMFLGSRGFAEFLELTKRRDSVWKDIEKAVAVHQAILDRELAALRTISFRNIGLQLPNLFARMFSLSGLFPDPSFLAEDYSAGFEYLDFCMDKVRNGAKPERNNPGLYSDLQLLWYLADSEIVLVTNEDFSAEIAHSPQRARIISFRGLMGG